jgi:hypothetical protein
MANEQESAGGKPDLSEAVRTFIEAIEDYVRQERLAGKHPRTWTEALAEAHRIIARQTP